MKALVVLFALVPLICAAEPVVVPGTSSPSRHFSILLSHDRATEQEPPDDSAPDVQIVATTTNKVLATFPFPADPTSDLQPLRTKVRAHWNPDGTTVALSFSERFYTHLLVYRLQGSFSAPESFRPVMLPDTGAIIRPMIPRFREFRSRWHEHFQGWPGRNTIQFSAGTGALIKPRADGDVGFWAVYSFSVDIADPDTPIIKRIERVSEDDY